MKTKIITVFVCALFLVIGCDQIMPVPGAEEVLNKFLDAEMHGRYAEAYEYVSTEDKAVKSLEAYQSSGRFGLSNDNPFADVLSEKTSFDIKKVTVTGDTAKASVDIAIPNIAELWGDILKATFMSVFSEEDRIAELKKEIAKKYKDQSIPMTTLNETYTLIKEDIGWKVFVDWKAEKIEQERKAAQEKARMIAARKEQEILNIIEEADNLYRHEDYASALDKYNDVLKLDNTHSRAKNAIKKTKDKLQYLNDTKEYISKVELKGFRVDLGERYGRTTKGIFGTIINHGDRVLREVELTVYFLDKNGVVIGEKNYYPVLVTGSSFRDGKLLKPNYIEDFGYSVENAAPSAWSEKVRAKITNIEFHKNE